MEPALRKVFFGLLVGGSILFLGVYNAGADDLVNSKHNLSYLGQEPCAYCHSVHNAVGGIGRPAYMGELPDITAVYNSYTMDHSVTVASANFSDAPLCLTCHDGASIGTFTDDAIRTELESKILGTNLDLTTDLSDDHPVGFVYDSTLDPELKDPAPPVYVEFGPGRDQMWCSSCHNVHDGTHTPFLVMSNEGSALCFSCHVK